MVFVRNEAFVMVFLAAEKGYLSAVTLIVQNRDVRYDLIDALCC